MEFYCVYKIGEDGGKFGCTYFLSRGKALEFYKSWEDGEPWSTVCLDYECTEDDTNAEDSPAGRRPSCGVDA